MRTIEQILPPVFALTLVACAPDQPTSKFEPPIPPRPKLADDTALFSKASIGDENEGLPWVAHLIAVDLDQDGRLDILACEAQDDQVIWLRNSEAGVFVETVLAAEMKAPVHAEATDFDNDGDLDILIASMSIIYPNPNKIGTIFALENQGDQRFEKRVLAENIDRVNDVRAGDFNNDGRMDLAIAQFGYDQGQVAWMEGLGDWRFDTHTLLNLSGAINVCLADFDANGTMDIAALVSQQWEEVHLFSNDGQGNFEDTILFGSTNEDFACSGMSVSDLNQDGRPDLLFTNGDGFGPTAYPGPRPWHGVQWLENDVHSGFKFHRIGDLPGAYSPIGVDLDKDGHMDVLALSCFNNWRDDQSVSMVWFRNNGNEQSFEPRVLAHTPTHLLTAAVADFQQTGDLQLVTGAFHAWPPYDNLSSITFWQPTSRP